MEDNNLTTNKIPIELKRHKLDIIWFQIYLEQGKLKVELVTPNNPKVIFDNYEESFNDGRWHVVVLSIKTNDVTFSVDYRPMKTTRLLKIMTGGTYLFAGGISQPLGYSNTIFQGRLICWFLMSITIVYLLVVNEYL